MPKYYSVTPEGIKIKKWKLTAACHEIQELVEKVIKLRGLSYGVRVICNTVNTGLLHDCFISIEILDANSQPFGLLEYKTEAFPFYNGPDVFLFKWHSSTTTNISGDSITVEEHIKRVLAHTFKPINRGRRRLPIERKK